MKPEVKRYQQRYGAAADAIARLDIDQEVREEVADALTQAFTGQPDFNPAIFRLTASDPLCLCAGPAPGVPCPHQRWIRIGMHLRDAPDGRSAAWRRRKPTMYCISCGAERFIPRADDKPREEVT